MLVGEIHRQLLELAASHIVADTIDYLEARFLFQTDDWEGLTKWAHFTKENYDGGLNAPEIYDIRLTDDCIRKQDHLNLSAGTWQVYLHGNKYADGNGKKVIERITTNTARLIVRHTGMLNGEPFPTVPPSAGEQIIARAEAAVKVSETAVRDTTEAAERAETAAERAEQVAIANGYVGFEIKEDGCLYLGRTTNIAEKLNFRLNDAGELEGVISG